MKLIIEIDDIKYQNIVNAYSDTNEIYAAIKNGTPLDKIRDEIEQERDKVYQNRQGCDTYYADGLDTALEIIDKYTKGAKE